MSIRLISYGVLIAKRDVGIIQLLRFAYKNPSYKFKYRVKNQRTITKNVLSSKFDRNVGPIFFKSL